MKMTVTIDGIKPGHKVYFTVTILGDFDKTTDLIADCRTHLDLVKLEKENLIKIIN